jgi:hypothetical protein
MRLPLIEDRRRRSSTGEVICVVHPASTVLAPREAAMIGSLPVAFVGARTLCGHGHGFAYVRWYCEPSPVPRWKRTNPTKFSNGRWYEAPAVDRPAYDLLVPRRLRAGRPAARRPSPDWAPGRHQSGPRGDPA